MDVCALADPEILGISPFTRVDDALSALRDLGSAYAFVISHERPIGIFSRQDVLNRVANSGVSAEDLNVSEVMDGKLKWFYGDWQLDEVAAEMVEEGVEHAIVRDRDGYMLGFVELSELLTPARRAIPFPKFEREQPFGLRRAG